MKKEEIVCDLIHENRADKTYEMLCVAINALTSMVIYLPCILF